MYKRQPCVRQSAKVRRLEFDLRQEEQREKQRQEKQRREAYVGQGAEIQHQRMGYQVGWFGR